MAEKVYECAIIGGGLAGLTLAIQLAEAGHSVILFEKEKYPFNKVCGEYISMESFNFLERIGIPLSEMDLPRINEVCISAPNGNALTRKLYLGGFGISRYTLDYALAKLAIDKGVTLLEETKVTGITFSNEQFSIEANGHTYSSKLVCGAYGKKSLVDRVLNRNTAKETDNKNYVAVKYHIQIEHVDNRIELHNFKGGYCGISKVDGDKYCLCYLTDSANLKESNNSIKEMEQRILMQNPYLKKYFTEATFLNEQRYTISQITFSKKTAVDQHVLMLGDSAGTIAPLCGNGMSMAMRASYCAAGLLQKYLKGSLTRSELERKYSSQWNSLFSNRIQAGRYLQGIFGKEKLTNTSIGILKHTPMLTDSLIRLTHGKPF